MSKSSKPPLHVRSTTPWGRSITSKSRTGKLLKFTNYDEAREYAKKHGYKGIKINEKV